MGVATGLDVVVQLKFECRSLRVPKYGAILEFLNFAVLLILFVLCLSSERSSVLSFSSPLGYADGFGVAPRCQDGSYDSLRNLLHNLCGCFRFGGVHGLTRTWMGQ